MRIAILGTRGIPARYGGFETFADEISRRLVHKGHEVSVFCEYENEDQPKVYEGVTLEYKKAPSLGPLSTILFDWRCIWAARKKYDVVYMLGYATSFFCFVPRLWGKPVWINMDGLEWARSKYNLIGKVYCYIMEAIALVTSSRIIADAQSIKQNLAKRYPFLPKCSVIEYGAPIINLDISSSILEEWDLEANQYYLMVCRLEPENHILEILEGYGKSHTKFPLIIVGNDHMATPYIQKCKALHDPRIRWMGTLYDQTKLQHLRVSSKGYFHGHSVGGTNPSLVEAMGCRNLIIAHDNSFNREVTGGQAFYFESYEEIPEIMDELEQLNQVAEEAHRKQMQERVNQTYTWEIITDKYQKLLNALGD